MSCPTDECNQCGAQRGAWIDNRPRSAFEEQTGIPLASKPERDAALAAMEKRMQRVLVAADAVAATNAAMAQAQDTKSFEFGHAAGKQSMQAECDRLRTERESWAILAAADRKAAAEAAVRIEAQETQAGESNERHAALWARVAEQDAEIERLVEALQLARPYVAHLVCTKQAIADLRTIDDALKNG